MGQSIRITPFMGMSPRIAERLLPDGSAVDATNLVLSSGEIRPIRQPLLVNTPAVSGPWLSVYRPEWNGSQKWLAWSKDVDIARAPLSSDVEARYYWTGDNEPRFSTFSSLPATFYALGIPAPTKKPTVAPTGGSGSTVSRVYAHTFFSALGEESALSPVSDLASHAVDGSWAVANLDTFPVNSGTGTASHSSGVTTFNNTGNHWLRKGDEVVISATNMLVTSIVDADSFTVAGNYAAATAWARVANWNVTGMKRRLYRSAGTNATFQLVADDVGTTYTDTLTDQQILGDELISDGWIPPPVNLRGMIALPSGAMCGFDGTQLCYSEPYQPHAWPLSYRFGADYEIIGIESFGSTVVACTAGTPYLSNGVDPASASADQVKRVWPCLSKRSIVSTGDGVMYSTSYGLAYVGLEGPSIWTEPFFSKVEWDPLNPSSMIAAMSDGKIFVRWVGTDDSKGVMVFNPSEASMGMTLLSDVPDELYSDPRNGRLYLVDADGIKQYDANIGARVNYSYKSKEYYLPNPVNMGAAKLDFVGEMSEADYLAAQAAYTAAVAANVAIVAGYVGLGSVNGSAFNALVMNGSNIASVSPPDVSSVTFSLYCDGQLVHSRNIVAGDGLFRLPSGFKSSTFQIGLTGTVRVKRVMLGETPAVLKAIP